MPIQRLTYAAILLWVVVTMGTGGYYFLGDGRWTLVDCAYMTVITLSTVGFAEVLPGMDEVSGARAWTVANIVFGSGTLLYFASAVIAFVIEGDLRGVLRSRRMEQHIDKITDHLIVCGCGDTGINVVAELLQTGRKFVVIERDAERVAWVKEELDAQFLHIVGDATDDFILERAGLERASALIACLHDDPQNLYVTITARALRDDLRIVTKALDPDAYNKMQRAGATTVVLTHRLGGVRLVNEATSPAVTDFIDRMIRLGGDPHLITEYRVTAQSPWAGQRVRDASMREHANALILAVRFDDGQYELNPSPDLMIEEGMALILLAEREKLSKLG